MTPLSGTITSVENFGSIVVVWVDPGSGEPLWPVYCDHRPFAHMLEGRRGALLGERVTYHEDGGEPALAFEEDT